jgi:hypothetical protein
VTFDLDVPPSIPIDFFGPADLHRLSTIQAHHRIGAADGRGHIVALRRRF